MPFALELIFRISKALVLTCLLFRPALHAADRDDRWWPAQALPKSVVRMIPEHGTSIQMMAQSIAGLAAKAVNDRRGDEMVWIATGNVDLEDWLTRTLTRHSEIKRAGDFRAWDLVDRYASRGLIKGYILYRLDQSRGELNAHRPGMDCSVNVATSLAGILDAIIVEENLENEAKARGLKLLLDARDKTQFWCFETYRDQFNRRMLCTQDPKKPHVRDLAIAQKTLTLFGNTEPVPAVMKWLEPLSPILGWNGGDEFETTDLSSRYAHIQTATDWCMNLPVLMAGTEKIEPPKLKDFNPRSIDWNDQRSTVTFVETDGDNVQWLQGNFFRSPSYWADPARGTIPFGWSSCFAHLAQLCPPVIEYALETKSPRDSFIEWGGGYYYPDHFAADRTNRWDFLARQMKRTWTQMKKTNSRVIGFNVAQHDSPDARKSYQVIAGQTDALLGILVFQYAPYEAGAGKIFWVKDATGAEIPVVTARYSIWEHSNNRPRAGTPAKIAREIRETTEKEKPLHAWVINHAWSYFKNAPGTDENKENLAQHDAPAQGGIRGYSPALWCAQRLSSDVRVVLPEELLWRIRMQHNPTETKKIMTGTP